MQRRLTGPRTNYDAAMMQFEQLICNKHFLMTFIETLESERTFSIRDKVNVASLLVITLMGNMEYATSVLRSLLFRLMDKAVSTKHPQLMLRRTESVVEKMLSNWMALSMYHYLKDRAGPSIFVLFKAIKYQVEKGPVDSMTHDARYSLSEERLLREQIDHSFVVSILFVSLNLLATITHVGTPNFFPLPLVFCSSFLDYPSGSRGSLREDTLPTVSRKFS